MSSISSTVTPRVTMADLNRSEQIEKAKETANQFLIAKTALQSTHKVVSIAKDNVDLVLKPIQQLVSSQLADFNLQLQATTLNNSSTTQSSMPQALQDAFSVIKSINKHPLMLVWKKTMFAKQAIDVTLSGYDYLKGNSSVKAVAHHMINLSLSGLSLFDFKEIDPTGNITAVVQLTALGLTSYTLVKSLIDFNNKQARVSSPLIQRVKAYAVPFIQDTVAPTFKSWFGY